MTDSIHAFIHFIPFIADCERAGQARPGTLSSQRLQLRPLSPNQSVHTAPHRTAPARVVWAPVRPAGNLQGYEPSLGV